MIIQKSKIGQKGEDIAVAHLTDQGYKILKRNYRNFVGEIDIIAADGDTLCFVEVKTRNDGQLGSPLEAVTPAKQRKICRVAQGYLQSGNTVDRDMRFDVVAVMLDGDQCRDVEIIKNAFEAS